MLVGPLTVTYVTRAVLAETYLITTRFLLGDLWSKIKPINSPKTEVCKPVARISTKSKNVAELSIGYEILSPGKTLEVAQEAAQNPSRSTDMSILIIIGRKISKKGNNTTRTVAATLPASPAHRVRR
jgi:hypothetical protein